jgi:hypothetical protein
MFGRFVKRDHGENMDFDFRILLASRLQTLSTQKTKRNENKYSEKAT